MLEHQKLMLQNLSYDKNLFKKELYKSMVWLNQEELTSLRRWLKDKYWKTHQDIIKETLYPVAV